MRLARDESPLAMTIDRARDAGRRAEAGTSDRFRTGAGTLPGL
jgi:hypothetical protein